DNYISQNLFKKISEDARQVGAVEFTIAKVKRGPRGDSRIMMGSLFGSAFVGRDVAVTFSRTDSEYKVIKQETADDGVPEEARSVVVLFPKSGGGMSCYVWRSGSIDARKKLAQRVRESPNSIIE